MKAGTIVQLTDGRIGTVVYHGLDGYGIKWGRHAITMDDLAVWTWAGDPPPPDYQWIPDAMLRDPWPGADLPCVGRDFEVVS